MKYRYFEYLDLSTERQRVHRLVCLKAHLSARLRVYWREEQKESERECQKVHQWVRGMDYERVYQTECSSGFAKDCERESWKEREMVTERVYRSGCERGSWMEYWSE